MSKKFTLEEAEGKIQEIKPILIEVKETFRRYSELSKKAQELITNFAENPFDKENIFEKIIDEREKFVFLIKKLNDEGVILRDIEMGLVNFLSEIDGEDVYLCWKTSDEKIAYWHRVNEDYSKRKPLNRKK